MPTVEAERVLGAEVAVGKGGHLTAKRVATARKRARRLQSLPTVFEGREALVAPGLLSLLYGQEAGPALDKRTEAGLRWTFADAARHAKESEQ